MKYVVHLFALGLTCSGLFGCLQEQGSDDATQTTVAGLSEGEAAAFDACLEEIADCRATGEDCRDVAECLPERPGSDRERGEDWRAFCEDLGRRCDGNEADARTCAQLRERCAASDHRPRDGAACMDGCLANGGDDAGCRLRCYPSDDDEPRDGAACMDECLANGGDDAGCRLRCYPSDDDEPRDGAPCMDECLANGGDDAGCRLRCYPSGDEQ